MGWGVTSTTPALTPNFDNMALRTSGYVPYSIQQAHTRTVHSIYVLPQS
jgi:hypothetical protein